MKQDPDPRPPKLATKLRQLQQRAPQLLRKNKGVKVPSLRRFQHRAR